MHGHHRNRYDQIPKKQFEEIWVSIDEISSIVFVFIAEPIGQQRLKISRMFQGLTRCLETSTANI